MNHPEGVGLAQGERVCCIMVSLDLVDGSVGVQTN
jgi:hypothetical protein